MATEPFSFHCPKIDEGVRCSDAVLASCLAAHPDAFHEPFPPKGVWPIAQASQPVLPLGSRRFLLAPNNLENRFPSRTYESPSPFFDLSQAFHKIFRAHVSSNFASDPLVAVPLCDTRVSLRWIKRLSTDRTEQQKNIAALKLDGDKLVGNRGSDLWTK